MSHQPKLEGYTVALLRQVWLTIQVVVVALLWLQAVGGAEAGHTIQTGSCWKSGEPRMCRNTWNQGSNLYILLKDQMSSYHAAWKTQSIISADNWTGDGGDTPGPQRVGYQLAVDDNDASWVYMKYAKCTTQTIFGAPPGQGSM